MKQKDEFCSKEVEKKFIVAEVPVIYVIWVTILLIKISNCEYMYVLYSSEDHQLVYSQPS